MIFVCLGTQDKSFKRLLETIENSNIDDKIIAQVGYTDFSSSKMEIHKYLDKDEYSKYLNEADIVITHGGVGTIMEALKANKKIIACPRLSKYHEHQNDHQLDIIDTFKKNNYLLALYEDDDINEVYQKALSFTPNKYISNNENFVSKLSTYLGI